jgi:hypothetical protein
MVLLSYQTKKQSIGYILKGALDSEVPAKRIEEIAEAAVEVVPRRNDIGNYDTSAYAVEIAEKLGLSEEVTASIKSGVWWAFDNNTVEEAGEICDKVFDAFFRYLKKQL